MSELTFDDFSKQAIASSSILPDDAIQGFAAMGKYQPIYMYCHRIAAHCLNDMLHNKRNKLPYDIDDTDLIDAVQDCHLDAIQVVQSWLANPTHKFASYASTAFRRTVARYLWTVAKGGTDHARGAGLTPNELSESYYEAGDESLTDGTGAYDDIPQGLRDPFEEVAAQQSIAQAVHKLSTGSAQAGKRRAAFWQETGFRLADLP